MRLSAALLFAAVLLSSPAHAGFMFDLTVSSGWTGSGSIDFTTQSGSSTADVDTFSFHAATGAGSPQDYGKSNINTISWSIDSSDDLTLLLTSKKIEFGFGLSAILLTDENGSNSDPCFSSTPTLGSITCDTSSGEVIAGGVLTATAVPEPGALALLAPALPGIAAYLLRRKI